jgi:hypothetical protein
MRAKGPFRTELLKLLAESDYVTTGGRPNLASFARDLNGIHYETVRRVVRGEAPVSLRLLEETARVLRLKGDYFRETPLLQAVQALDPRRPLDLAAREPEEDLPPVSDEAVDALNKLLRGH